MSESTNGKKLPITDVGMQLLRNAPADSGMQHEGFCECSQARTTQCDVRKHPFCVYARAKVEGK